MLFETAKSVKIVIFLLYPKIVDFMQKHYSVATFVHINLAKKSIFSLNYLNSALNIVIMVV